MTALSQTSQFPVLSSGTLQRYLDSIQQIPVLTAEEDNQTQFLATGVSVIGKTTLFFFLVLKCPIKTFLTEFCNFGSWKSSRAFS